MRTFAGVVGERVDDYYIIWFWEPEEGTKLDFPIGVQFIPDEVDSGDLIWIGTDTNGEIFVKKRTTTKMPGSYEKKISTKQQAILGHAWRLVLDAERLQRLLYFFSILIKNIKITYMVHQGRYVQSLAHSNQPLLFHVLLE